MKKYVLLSVMVLSLSVSGTSWGQSAPNAGNHIGSQGTSGVGAGQAGDQQQFEAHKTEMLARLTEHQSAVQQKLACVQAAANHDALRECMAKNGAGSGH